MKALVVFNESASISFYTVDREFRKHLQDRMGSFSESASPQVPSEEGEDDLREALGLFFLPLVASFNILQSLKKPLLSISGDNDWSIVFHQYDSLVLVALSDEEAEELLKRKLHVFSRIIGLLYGPAIARMIPANLMQRKMEWSRLESLLKSYEKLYSEEQAFLLEAVEHIRFGQLNTAQNSCVSFAEDCLNSNLNGGISNAKHAMLLVGTKMLAVVGRSPQLPTADTLLLTLLVANTYYHTNRPPSEEEPVQVTTVIEQEQPASSTQVDLPVVGTTGGGAMGPRDPVHVDPDPVPATEARHESDDQDLFGTPIQSPPLTPGLPSSRSEDPFSDKEDTRPFRTPVDDELHAVTFTPSASKSIGGKLKTFLGGLVQQGQGGGSDVPPEETLYPTDQMPVMGKYYEQKVFLQLNQGLFIPHVVHCMEVHENVVLVLISELLSSNLAGVICQTLVNLRQIFTSGRSISMSGRNMFEILDGSIRRITEGAKAEAKTLNSQMLRNRATNVNKTWSKLKEAQLLRYLEKHIQDDLAVTKVTTQGDNLIDSLTSLYEELYFSPRVQEYDVRVVNSRLMKLSSKLSRDYGEFLAWKANINLPFPGLSINFPGMVHFAFVDRSFDELTSPCIVKDIVSDHVVLQAKKHNQSPSEFLKKKLWMMVQRTQKYLGLGYTSQTWIDEDFLYSYCLWISMLNPNLGTPLRLATPANIRTVEDEPTGVLCGNFYRGLTGGMDGATPGYINELFCIHEASVPLDLATSQCKGLAVQLWMNTKQALAPFPLIN